MVTGGLQRHRFIAGGAALAAIIVGYMALDLWNGYHDTLLQAQRLTGNLVQVVASDASGVFNVVDLTLNSIDQSLLSTPRTGIEVKQLLERRVKLVPYTRALFITDADGRVVHTSGRFDSPPYDVADRGYFRRQRDGQANGIAIGAPVVSKVLHTPVIPVSRRLTTADAKFGGIVVAVVDPRHFQEFFASIDTGEHGSVSLYLRDGTLLARGPQMDGMIGKAFPDSPLFRDMLPRGDAGTSRAASTLDGVARIFSYRTFSGGRLVALVGVGESEVLARWRRESQTQILTACVFLATVAWFGALLYRQTQRQRALTDELRDSEARLGGMVASAMDAIITVDDAQQVVQFNPAAEQMFGRQAAEVEGRPLDLLIPGRYRTAHRTQVREFGASGATNRRMGALGAVTGLRASGEEFPIEASISQLIAHGRKFYTVILRDITERRRAEEEQHRYVGQLQALHDVDKAILAAQSPAAVAATGLAHLQRVVPYWAGTVRTIDHAANEAAVLATEHAADAPAVVGRLLTLDQFGRADLEELRRGRVCVRSDISAVSERPAAVQSLYERGMLSHVRIPLTVEGALVAVLALGSNRPDAFDDEQVEIARAIGDQLAIALQQAFLRQRIERQSEELERRVAQRTAQLEQANKELEAFSYSVSHDLRAPLRHIDGFAKLLGGQVDKLDETAARYLGIISRSAARMGLLIDDLLAFSRMSRAQVRMESVDLARLVAEVREECLRDAPGRDIEWSVGPLPVVAGDAVLLRQVFVNLIANAVKFTSRRERATIGIDAQTGDAREVVICVSDNGAGFDMRYADKLFGVFQRLHREDEFEGTGIGLASVRRIVTRHGGRVWAQSEPDRGSSFFFTLTRA